MEKIKELLAALLEQGLTDEEVVKVLDQKLADQEITQEEYDWAIQELAKLKEQTELKQALELLGVE
jgi:hypothetical protein